MSGVELKDRRVLVTGGAGFLGQCVVARLREAGSIVTVPRSRECDLREQSAARGLLEREKPELVVHLAACGGGIGFMRDHPGKAFYDNAIMSTILIHESFRADVKKFLGAGTVCSYPKFAAVPFKEENLWNGFPEETNAPYGLAKRMMVTQSRAYRGQYGFNAVVLLIGNLYGPNDDFDLNNSHVVPAMIRRFVEATEKNSPEIVFWGDGSPTREFVFVEDAADGIVRALERYDGADPVNLGSGEEISIRDLAATVAELVGFKGKISWDVSKPNGQPRRKLNTARARELFGWEAKVPLKEGLRRTVEWYRGEGQVMWAGR